MAELRAYTSLVLLNVAALGGAMWYMRDPRPETARIELPPTVTLAPRVTPLSPTPPPILVHVSGAVVRPGIVRLGSSGRVADAVGLAGGFRDDAETDAINLAAALSDGQQLHVPSKSEAEPPPAGLRGGPVGGDAGVGGGNGNGGVGSEASGQPGPGRLNINTAGAAELEALPGIGPSLAARIVADREANGPFGAPGDLTRVPGIGPKTLEKFADQIEAP